MTTKVYGTSDDLIELDGDVSGEVMIASGPSLLMFSDGTLLEVGYGKGELAIWYINVLRSGAFFRELIPCIDEDEEGYSDVALFNEGLTWAYHAKSWERVK